MAEEIFRSERTGDGAEFLQIHPLDSRYPVKTFFTARSGGSEHRKFFLFKHGIFDRRRPRGCGGEQTPDI